MTNVYGKSAFYRSNLCIKELMTTLPDVFLVISKNYIGKYSEGRLLKESIFEDFPIDNSEIIFGLTPNKINKLSDSNLEPIDYFDITIAKRKITLSFYDKVFEDDFFEQCWIINRDEGRTFEPPIFVFEVDHEDKSHLVFSAVDIETIEKIYTMQRNLLKEILFSESGYEILSKAMHSQSEDISFIDMMADHSEKVLKDVKDSKELEEAEANRLSVTPKMVNTSFVIQTIVDGISDKAHKKGIDVEIYRGSQSELFRSDIKLLLRSLREITQNIVDNSVPGHTVLIRSTVKKFSVVFHIWNQLIIDKEKKLGICMKLNPSEENFQANNLYKAKIIIERYLKGLLTFDSNESKGTEFMVILPFNLDDDRFVDLERLAADCNEPEIDSPDSNKRILDNDEPNISDLLQ